MRAAAWAPTQRCSSRRRARRSCVADVNLEAAEAVAAQARDAFAVQVDVADESSVQAMYAAAKERYGGIDVLYNNAGISPADDDSILETDLRMRGSACRP